MMLRALLAASLFVLSACTAAPAQPPQPAAAAPPPAAAAPVGYYRQPAIGGSTIVFVAEGDLWKVPLSGGVATRLTSHPGDEFLPAISPDGSRVAFAAEYDGTQEIYVMPLSGGQPRRLTYDGTPRCGVAGWTPDGKVLAFTDKLSTLPNLQLTTIDPATGVRSAVPLWQAADGAVNDAGVLAFVRLPFQGSATKRYRGGFIQQLWRFAPGDAEATALTADFPGTSKRPMWANGRIYFVSDRDGHMNIWSMSAEGKDLRQHTRHSGLDVQGGSTNGRQIAYQLGADIRVLDLASDRDAPLPISLDSDLDQTRERWADKPLEFLTSARISPDGDRVVLTARGRVFVAPHRQGRIADVARDDAARYRAARFMPDGKSIVALSDASGEVEIWSLPANGVGAAAALTADGSVLRWDAIPSPDGKWLAHHDKNQKLWVMDLAAKTSVLVDTQPFDDFSEIAWSPDSRWLAYVNQAGNMFKVIKIWSVETKAAQPVTTDRFDSFSPAWSRDGKWLFFLSDRTLRTLAPSPWGPYAPKPFLTDTTRVMALALTPGERWPFLPKDELQAPAKPEPAKPEPAKPEPKNDDAPKADPAKDDGKKDEPKKNEPRKDDKPAPKPVRIEFEGILERLFEAPVPAGNYASLQAADKALFLLATPTGFDARSDLKVLEIKNEAPELKTLLPDISFFELSADGKKLLARRRDTFYIVDAGVSAPSDLDKLSVNLGGWTFPFKPRVQWRQMYADAWRLMRDYFYDPNMHGVDWPAMKAKYAPLVDRVSTRAELNDVLAQMVGELSALHHFVRGGDGRTTPAVDRAPIASLGAAFVRDPARGGFRIERIYRHDPDEPSRAAPLARPEVNARPGWIITEVDGVPALSAPDIGELLRHKAGRQVLLRINTTPDVPGPAVMRDVVAIPFSADAEAELRYDDWTLSRRLEVESAGKGDIGYVHLRAMGGGNYTEWAKGFFPVFNRKGLIIDVRHNRGGNIDSWILSELLRRQWFTWSPRVGLPYWNMQYAFRGHVVVLCNERTASDGEAFAEGFRRLGLGKVIGMRTWGGEIWLSSSNVLLDRGLASAAEIGVFGPEGTWLIEGHGVDPDIVVDNPPAAAFRGEDAQLRAAIAYLQQQIAEKPVPDIVTPPKPDKSDPSNRRR
ncbi:MAG: PD40 domain-containing protein [Phycisphaerae bacterium]|nr:PD40 domain-containing protein [Phycisphaerae bacterium]